MSLSDRFATQFSPMAINRGEAYFRIKAVTQISGDEFRVEADVEGGSTYRSLLSFNPADSVLSASCTCAYFTDRFLACKHLWATLLAAEEAELLGAARLAVSPVLVETEADEDDDELLTPDEPRSRRVRSGESAFGGKPYVPAASWRIPMRQLRDTASLPRDAAQVGALDHQLLYVLDAQPSAAPGRLVLQVAERKRKAGGEWGRPKSRRVALEDIASLPNPDDREIFALLTGSDADSLPHDAPEAKAPMRYRLKPQAERALVSRMCATGRCFASPVLHLGKLRPLHWEDSEPWTIHLAVADTPSESGGLLLVADVARGAHRFDLSDPEILVGSTVLISGTVASPLEAPRLESLIDTFRRIGPIEAPVEDEQEFIEELMTLPAGLQIDLPERLAITRERPLPHPRLFIASPQSSRTSTRLDAELSFDYAGHVISLADARTGVYDAARKRIVLRDPATERDAVSMLLDLGLQRPKPGPEMPSFTLSHRAMVPAVRALVGAGWTVQAEGRLYRVPGNFRLEVGSGVDWFELRGALDFGDETALLPELIRAASSKDHVVKLGDGSLGLLPEDWLEQFEFLTRFGTRKKDHVRFELSQVALLDALLANLPESDCDEAFTAARQRLRDFGGIHAIPSPPTFQGTLRHYQEEGLGWLEFLREFGFGGCLADDMGLGKTIQVLALLESLRANGKGSGNPSLVVAPRSVLWNWKREAERFTPKLRVGVHAGMDRVSTPEAFDKQDLIITTYGTLRRDVLLLKDLQFDTVILDEAQAVKNAATVGAKAVRLLQARNRLALSGTPVENHLGELWSLFEFLNPGMLGSSTGFRKLVGGTGFQEGHDGRDLIARSVAPFILRRTKSQVAPELPEKTEQTLFCELEPAQRKQYDELRDHYRRMLRDRVQEVGLAKSKIHILEALLRLRQAACHPRLIDASAEDKASAKLDLLVPQLQEVIEEGSKALVFSQFTRFLAVLKDRLDAEGIAYEYLDGRTRNREEKVDRFQEDPSCSLFLISLKAGGVGLNLTAAEYVFLLDPWWNPAVESQAIDRAHRIGQTRPVFAYRLIAKDTVEERILDLQEQKRDLAASILAKDGSLLKTLRAEDLEILLS